jgi:diguanylate cyclase (GGDEF)-like protein
MIALLHVYLFFTITLCAIAFWYLRRQIRRQYESGCCVKGLLVCALLQFVGAFTLSLVYIFSSSSLSAYGVIACCSALNISALVIFFVAKLLDTERKRFKEIELFQLQHDPLTGLPKHPMFIKHVEQLLAQHSQQDDFRPVILVILISGMRQLDRTVGFGVSDFIIKTVAQRVHATLRATDYIARLGENLLAVYIEDLRESGDIHTIANNISLNIKKPIQVDADNVPILSFMGAAFYDDPSLDAYELIKYAQTAAFDACDRGMEVIVADSAIHADEYSNDLLNVLQRSIKENSFEIYYQPQINVQSLQVIGAEALLRIPGNTGMSIGGGELIELAERNGMIHQIDMLVFKQVFAQIKTWIAKDIKLRIAVNMSVKSFRNHSLLDYIFSYLNDQPDCGKQLKIEITETANLDNIKEIVAFMKKLIPKGVLFSADDFGTRYSSIEYMQRLPVHEVKIDKSFVLSALNDVTSEKIIRSVIQLAHGLDLSVTAEGVENEEILQLLRAWKCDHAQGYYFSQAMSADNFEDYYLKSL